MREDTKKRLERAILIERMKKVGIGLGVLAVLGAVIALHRGEHMRDGD